jgi:hypothetical protein
MPRDDFDALDPPDTDDSWKVHQLLYDKFRDEPDVDLIFRKHVTVAYRQALETEAVEV